MNHSYFQKRKFHFDGRLGTRRLPGDGCSDSGQEKCRLFQGRMPAGALCRSLAGKTGSRCVGKGGAKNGTTAPASDISETEAAEEAA